ncbi:hypothetical protein CDD82_2180 [Ophiocordyceps australis]|uniref:CHL4 family chromosome segregation protein n=1 Tax=Ophiocordyceps australis TaxID=1399860 RepID=A0A2C5ZJ50_9HYPO|nr:hypothetical protein CDD82_2180 [Ophiocordyceps australis]
MARLSVPARARLPSSLRIDSSNPALSKNLMRLSRETLISLALDWLDDASLPNAAPYLARQQSATHDDDDQDGDDQGIYPPCRSIQELRDVYFALQQQKGSKRDVASRILEGDWRHGLTLYQLAMIDFAHLDQHPSAHKWTAYRILPLKAPSEDSDHEVLQVDKKSLTIPRFHPSTFLHNFQRQVLPDLKVHYHFHRLRSLPLLLLRIFVIESPYNTVLAVAASGEADTAANFPSYRTIYLAFPDGSPSLYISKSQTTGPINIGESKSLISLIVSGVPKALSRPRQRYTLRSTNLSSRNLGALLDKRGPGRSNAAGGGWSIYANEQSKQSPLDPVLPEPPFSRTVSGHDVALKRQALVTATNPQSKRLRLMAEARFGHSGIITDGKGVEGLQVLMQDPFPQSERLPDVSSNAQVPREPDNLVDRRQSKLDAVVRQARTEVQSIDDEEDNNMWTPTVGLSFQGPHVFAGIRQLVEIGVVDGERMPGWMTGEDGVTSGVVRHGRIKAHKGSGL